MNISSSSTQDFTKTFRKISAHQRSSLLPSEIPIIRRVEEKDVDQFWTLKIKSLTTDPDIFVATMEEEMANSREDVKKRLRTHYTLGAFVKEKFPVSSAQEIVSEKLVGTLVLMEQPQAKFKHIGILGGMYVDPDYRQLGIGKSLLGQMLEDIKKFPKFEALQLKVITSNEPAIRLYESFGFFRWASEEKALKANGKYFDQYHYQRWV